MYDCDIDVSIDVKDSKVVGRYINLYKHKGSFEGKRYTYKKDIKSIKKTIDYTNIVTKLYGYGKGEEIVDEDGKSTGGYGRKINFSEINDGKAYITNEEARLKYGVGKEKKHIEGKFEDGDCEDKKELLELTKKELEKRSKPQISYELKVEDLSKYPGHEFEGVGLGDDVIVKDKELDLTVYTRIIKIIDSPFDNSDTEITLGNYIKDISNKFLEYEDLRKSIESRNISIGEEIDKLAKSTEQGFLKSLVDRLNTELNATGGYVYFEQGKGIIILNEPKEGNPTQAITLKGGTIAIANKKKANGDWDWTTFGTGNGFTASVLTAGILKGGKVRWNLEDGTLLIGNNPDDYNLYWDGETLHLRNTKIDYRYDKAINDLKDDIDKKISKEDVLEDKEIQEALRGKDGANGVPGKDGKQGVPGKDGKDGHTLTVEVWLEGEFRNHKTKDVKRIIQAKYDGEPINLTDSNTEVYNCYGDGKWNKKNLSDYWANWDRQYEYIANKVVVSYKGLKAEAYARLDNIKDGEKGEPGKQGVPGKDGKQGVPGKDGKDGHVLTVEVWLEGEFRNYKTKDVKRIIQAKYDGELIELDSTNTEVYNCYGNGEWSRAALSDFWADWDRQYEYIANKVIVTYKGLKAEAYARLDNIKDGEKGEPGKNGIDGKDGKTGKIGQNLLRNSNVPVENKDYNTKEWTLCETPTTGETMTFTVKIKLEKDDKLMVYNSGGMITLDWWTDVSKSKDYAIYSSTFNWRDKTEYSGKIYEQSTPPSLMLYAYSNGNGNNKNNNTVSIEWATLTRGDIPAIEWSPCHADIDDAIKAGKEKTEEVSRKLIKVESDFKVENNNIKASVSSLSETTERSFVNLKKDMADADVKVETGIKNYLINNYSTKTQTDQKISQEVGGVKASIGNIKQEITRTKTSIEQTNKKIETKVSKDGFSSLVKQEFDNYTVQARNINFDGSNINVKGTFQTLNDSNDVGIKIDYNNIRFQDNRWNGRVFGNINVTRQIDGKEGFSLNIGHYRDGYLGLSYFDENDKLWHDYVTFDIFGKSRYYTKGYEGTFHGATRFKKTVLFDSNIQALGAGTFSSTCKFERDITFGGNRIKIVNYADGLGIVNGKGEGLFISGSGAVYVQDTQAKYRVAIK